MRTNGESGGRGGEEKRVIGKVFNPHCGRHHYQFQWSAILQGQRGEVL